LGLHALEEPILPDDAWVLRAPRLNQNDDAVTLTRWLALDRSQVVAGQPVAEIETEKATAELIAGAAGLFLHAVEAGVRIAVGAPLAYVGRDLAALARTRRAHGSTSAPDGAPAAIAATAKARALAQARGIDLARVPATGATIKETDVARVLAEHGGPASSIAHDARLIFEGKASPRQLRVARNLREARQAGIFTTLAYTLDLRGPQRMIAAETAGGRTASLLGVLLLALGKTLPAFPRLISVPADDGIYRYRDIDVAFAVRSPEGDLSAPVVRQVDRLAIGDIARACARLTKSAMRGKLAADDTGGACFTVSLIPTPNVESFVALPAPLQSAILAVGAERAELALTSAGVVARPVATATVTYDHAMCDGVDAARFCEALDRALNPEPA
jgi:pyruvate/2-oxoglutarate dehydrogenase complex dihydrolipoamide acyltransferase (E2) component